MTSGSKVRWVRCPACGGASRYAPDNPFRPFCCERCQGVDLGAWASETFRMPAVDTDEDSNAAESPKLQ